MAKSAKQKIEDLLGNLDELIEQAHKDKEKDVREGVAAELVRESKRSAEILRALMEDNEFGEGVTDYPNFRAGMRFAAMLLADTRYEY